MLNYTQKEQIKEIFTKNGLWVLIPPNKSGNIYGDYDNNFWKAMEEILKLKFNFEKHEIKCKLTLDEITKFKKTAIEIQNFELASYLREVEKTNTKSFH